MGAQSHAIMALMNQIRDRRLVLPDIQRDFVWSQDQIRLLFDSLMQGFPFGALLLWETRYVEVPYREFVTDYKPRQSFTPHVKPKGQPLTMVLDGQQRLQSLYIALFGTYEGKQLYFNVTSGPGVADDDSEGSTYRFEFWHHSEPNRPKRLVRVADIALWGPRSEETAIDSVLDGLKLEGDERTRAARNMRLLRQMLHQPSLVPAEMIDQEAPNEEEARTIDEVVEIFVRVNSGGTRLSRSDLMFSLLKSQWEGARTKFDELVEAVDPNGFLGIDKDFIIRGLLTVADKPPSYDVDNLRRHREAVKDAFDTFAAALRTTIDFCRDCGLASASLIRPVSTLFPVIYYLSRRPNASVPDAERGRLRSLLYFLLFNGFLKDGRPDARIRYLRSVLQEAEGDEVPLDRLLNVIRERQKHHQITTTVEMLNWNPRLALNIAQPGVARETLSWQSRAEVDHIFPQSIFREKYPELVDDIGNLAYLGKLQNIRKNAIMPAEYFKDVPPQQLMDEYLIHKDDLGDFERLVSARRERILQKVRGTLGR